MFVRFALTDDMDVAMIITPNSVCTGVGFRPRVPIGDASLRYAINGANWKLWSGFKVQPARQVKPPLLFHESDGL